MTAPEITALQTVALEWMAFGSALISVWFYGRSVKKGAMLGMVASTLFIIWGVSNGIYAAAFTNVAFFVLNFMNFARSCDRVPTKL